MQQEMALQCRCGRVAQVSPEAVVHVVCYCEDCQAFARHLQRADVLDAASGTDICHIAPARVRITQGSDAIGCLRLSEKGMHRWYTECCKTPIANTVTSRVPFIGLVLAFADPATASKLDSLIGMPTGINASSATGEVPAYAHAKAPAGLLLRIVKHLLSWWVTRQGRPNPFFQAQGEPIAKPYVLTAAERASLRQAAPRPVAAAN
jgi:hypothetical protein